MNEYVKGGEIRKCRKRIRESDAYQLLGCIRPKEAYADEAALASHVRTCIVLNFVTSMCD